MDDTVLSRVLPDQLESLLSLRGSTSSWNAADLADMLLHQLAVGLLSDLRPSESLSSQSLEDLVGLLGSPDASFGDLLAHPMPPIDLLRAVKDFAKSCDQDPEQPLPPQIATTIYYAAIAAAMCRHNVQISSLQPADLLRGVEWALDQTWAATPILSRLFQEAQCLLKSLMKNS